MVWTYYRLFDVYPAMVGFRGDRVGEAKDRSRPKANA
jgi:hypothetical protein